MGAIAIQLLKVTEEVTSHAEPERCEEEHFSQGHKCKVPEVRTRSTCTEELQENQYNWTGMIKAGSG